MNWLRSSNPARLGRMVTARHHNRAIDGEALRARLKVLTMPTTDEINRAWDRAIDDADRELVAGVRALAAGNMAHCRRHRAVFHQHNDDVTRLSWLPGTDGRDPYFAEILVANAPLRTMVHPASSHTQVLRTQVNEQVTLWANELARRSTR